MRNFKLVILLLIISMKGFCSNEIIPVSPVKGFIENKGQVRDQAGNPNSAVLYSKDFNGMKVQLRKDGFSYELYQVKPKWVDPATIPYKIVTISSGGDTSSSWPGQADAMKNKMYHYHRVDVTLEGGCTMACITPEDKGTSGDRWLLGKNNPQTVEVSKYGQIRYSGIYPGIDMICYANSATGGFKYDFILHPGADPSLIGLSYNGAESLTLTLEGTLEIKTRFGNMTESIPLCYKESSDGIRTPLTGIQYELSGNVIGFKGVFQGIDKLVIDPAVNLFWASYFGGDGGDVGKAVVTSSNGDIYHCGITTSATNISTTGAYFDSLTMPVDGFLSKYSSGGQLLWATYLGGHPAADLSLKNDLVVLANTALFKFDTDGTFIWEETAPAGLKAVCIDRNDDIIAAGDSVYAPPGYVPHHITDTIVKFNSSGVKLWARSYGGVGTEINDVACDSIGNIYIAGKTTDTVEISTSGAHQSNYGGSKPIFLGSDYRYELIGNIRYGDGFLAKLDPDGQTLFGTYYGGMHYDQINSIAVGNSGDIVVTGETNSRSNIATPGAFRDSLNPNGVVCFFFIAIGYLFDCPDPNSWALIDTCIIGCYMPKPYDARCQNTDAFVARFSPAGSRLWGTYLGDTHSEFNPVIHSTKSLDTIVVAGNGTGNSCHPLLSSCPAWQLSVPLSYMSANGNCFAVQLDSSGNKILGTYFPQEADVTPGNHGNWLVTSVHYDKRKILVTGGTVYESNAFLVDFTLSDMDTLIQPKNESVCEGDSIVLTTGVITFPLVDLDFQWIKNGTILAGAIDSTLIIPNASPSDSGNYYCLVSQDDFSWKTNTVNVLTRDEPAFDAANDVPGLQNTLGFFDFDNDGDLDILTNSSIIRKDSYSYLQPMAIPFPYDYIAMNDYNNDGKTDILSVSSLLRYPEPTQFKVRILRNDLDSMHLVQYDQLKGTVAWADFNNDGHLEGLKLIWNWITGTDFYLCRIINDTVVETFAGSGPWGLHNPCAFKTSLADYDNDGDVDVLFVGSPVVLSGSGCGGGSIARILRNDNGIFTALDQGFPADVWFVNAIWTDCNDDGNMDFVFFSCDQQHWENPTIRVYANVNGNFTNSQIIHPVFNQGTERMPEILSMDYDNDGKTDLVVRDAVLKNTGTGFEQTSTSSGQSFSGITAAAVGCGDMENDHDLDILADSKLYENSVCNPPNTPPLAPQGLQVSVSNDSAVLTWLKSNDLQTPQNGLTYNLRVGTTHEGNEILSSMSDSTGWRKVVGMGNAFQNTSWWLHNLQPGTYFWSVQAIDNSFAGGPFATEKSFVIPMTSLPVPLVNDTFSCRPGVVVLTATGAGPGETYLWFSDPCSAYSIGSGSPFTTPFLSQSDTFYVAIDSAGFQSIRKKIVVSVFAATVAGEVTGGGTIFFGMGATLKLEGHTGAVLKWQKRWNGGAWMDIAETGTSYTEVPDTTGIWDYRAEVRSGSCAILFSDFATVIVQPVSRTINLTLFLEGLFNPSTLEMNKARDENGDMYPGTIADIIQVHLAKATTPYSFYYSVNGADLNQDGTCTITVPRAGFFYLVLRHRNSIETWSTAPVSLLIDNSSYDFSTAASKAYGDNLKEISGKWVIWCGDVNQDRLIDLGDMIDVDNDMSNFVTGYVVTDVNGDGIVDSNDMQLIRQNSDLFISSALP